MNLRKYIDTCIISEYVERDCIHGYSLHVEDLPRHELESFFAFAFEQDGALKEMIMERLQELVDERLPFFETSERYERGERPMVMKSNGEVVWTARGGY